MFCFFSVLPQDRQLKIKDLVLSAHERAVRNCPWTMGLWKSYLLALERHGADHQTVTGTHFKHLCVIKRCRTGFLLSLKKIYIENTTFSDYALF